MRAHLKLPRDFEDFSISESIFFFWKNMESNIHLQKLINFRIIFKKILENLPKKYELILLHF